MSKLEQQLNEPFRAMQLAVSPLSGLAAPGLMSQSENLDFQRCCQQISDNTGSVAAALATILDQRLYRGRYTSFEDFVHAECTFGRAYAYRLVQAHRVRQKFSASTFVDAVRPENIAQAAELATVPEEGLQEVMRNAKARAGFRAIRRKHIRAAVRAWNARRQPAESDLRSMDLGEDCAETPRSESAETLLDQLERDILANPNAERLVLLLRRARQALIAEGRLLPSQHERGDQKN